MSYDARLLFAQISVRLDEAPARSLLDLSREFHIGTRTIQNVVATMTGRRFADFKNDILFATLTRLFAAKPAASIKELSFDLGYKSSRSFARAVRRACGVSPLEFRDQLVAEVASQGVRGRKASTAFH